MEAEIKASLINATAIIVEEIARQTYDFQKEGEEFAICQTGLYRNAFKDISDLIKAQFNIEEYTITD